MKTTGPITRTTSTRRPIRGILNSKNTDPLIPASWPRTIRICASHASRWVGIIAKSQFAVSRPSTLESSEARNSAMDAPYQARNGDAVLVMLDIFWKESRSGCRPTERSERGDRRMPIWVDRGVSVGDQWYWSKCDDSWRREAGGVGRGEGFTQAPDSTPLQSRSPRSP